MLEKPIDHLFAFSRDNECARTDEICVKHFHGIFYIAKK